MSEFRYQLDRYSVPCPATGWEAAWWNDTDSDTHPIRMPVMAWANVVRVAKHREYAKDADDRAIVGIVCLNNGEQVIPDNDDNFLGYFPAGQGPDVAGFENRKPGAPTKSFEG